MVVKSDSKCYSNHLQLKNMSQRNRRTNFFQERFYFEIIYTKLTLASALILPLFRKDNLWNKELGYNHKVKNCWPKGHRR